MWRDGWEAVRAIGVYLNPRRTTDISGKIG
jgi:hypothetical protein